MKIDFLYLNEEDMIKAGVLDAGSCIETMRETLSLFGKNSTQKREYFGDVCNTEYATSYAGLTLT